MVGLPDYKTIRLDHRLTSQDTCLCRARKCVRARRPWSTFARKGGRIWCAIWS